ncbi:MAG: putative DEAD/DEAH box helicase domain protein [Parcubacteria group bacterium Athens0714_16]|nr:MAG: putative DEAD/DEAH box helicase domain protein [Parcubacteria group bacterium Athens0714_16]
MYRKSNTRSSRFGRTPSSGRRNNFSSSNNRGKSRGRFGSTNTIHPSLFVCKADPIMESAPFIPIHKFADFKIDTIIKNNISKKGYITPTPIQDSAIPFVLNGRDVVGVANTGTGKTAAFLVPLLDKILKNPREKVLIIVPTRELAMQINKEVVEFRGHLKIFSVCCVGGIGIYNQISDLRRSKNFVIGTPGRLKDLVERKNLHLSEFKTLVLDEADRMMDMGFIDDMRFLMSGMAANRQTLFFSATITSEIDKLIREFLNNPEKISVKTGATARNVEQDIVRVRVGENKIDSLQCLLTKKEFSKVLIFGRTKNGVERLCQTLVKKGFRAESIHGDKRQSKRQSALKSFRDNHSQILVATDVAARGLDIPNVTHVINYDLPATYEDYVHRIGRTGRADQVGTALTFVD